MSDQAKTAFEEYVLDTEHPRFTDWLRQRSEPTFTKATEHSFTRELGAGTLSDAAFAEYLVQDYAFVTDLVGAFGRTVGDAPSMASKRRLVEFLATLTDEENDYFERSFDALNVSPDRRSDPELEPPTEAFIDLLDSASRRGGYAESLAVLVPAEWIYAEWATAVKGGQERDEFPFYLAEWIDLHANPAFVSFVEWFRGELDRVGPSLHPRRQRRVERLFARTVSLEAEFFEAAYRGDD